MAKIDYKKVAEHYELKDGEHEARVFIGDDITIMWGKGDDDHLKIMDTDIKLLKFIRGVLGLAEVLHDEYHKAK